VCPTRCVFFDWPLVSTSSFYGLLKRDELDILWYTRGAHVHLTGCLDRFVCAVTCQIQVYVCVREKHTHPWLIEKPTRQKILTVSGFIWWMGYVCVCVGVCVCGGGCAGVGVVRTSSLMASHRISMFFTGRRRRKWCLIFVGHVLLQTPIISGSFAERSLQLTASYASSPPCARS